MAKIKKYVFNVWVRDTYEIVIDATSKQEAEKILNDNLNHEKYDFRYLPVETDGKTVYKGIRKMKDKQ